MKKVLYISLFLLLTNGLQAQDRRPGPDDGPGKDRVEAMKIGFLTEKLSLTPEEAQKFWPVYNAYTDELQALRKGRRENFMQARDNMDDMSPAEIEKAVDNEIIFRQNELDIIKKYHPQFKQILPMKKVARLYRAEEEFKRRLLEIIQEKRGGQERPMRRR